MKISYGVKRNLTKEFNKLVSFEQDRRDNINDKKQKKFIKGL